MKNKYDVAVIGGGPAGLAAAIAASKQKKEVLLIERESKLGGILKQCIHDGFGLLRFGEKLSGPEYVGRFIDELKGTNVDASVLTFVTKMKKEEGGYRLFLVTREGIKDVFTKTIVLATGCRERTAKQVLIQGTRPAGVFTAGTAQYFVNIMGKMPTKRCVILGSGDIGLIMARRLTLEGAEVEGVYEVKPTPSGLNRNIAQCLNDFHIPLHLSHTVTKVFGKHRLEGVEIAKVDEKMQPITGTERRVDCDALILSVGLIPENEVVSELGVNLDGRTKGAAVDQSFMTGVDGIYSCGNCLHVNDLVDYVSEGAEIAGKNAACYTPAARKCVNIEPNGNVLYVVPQKINILGELCSKIYFRTNKDMDNAVLSVKANGAEVFSKKYAHLRPPEMESVVVDFGGATLEESSKIEFSLDWRK